MARGPLARRPWPGFAFRASVYMIAAFTLRWAVLSAEPWAFGFRDAVFIFPVLALLAAAVGPWRRRASYAGVLVILYLLGDALAILTGVQALAESGGSMSEDLGVALSVAAFHAWRVGLPIVILIAFIGDDPAQLWKKRKSSGRKGKR